MTAPDSPSFEGRASDAGGRDAGGNGAGVSVAQDVITVRGLSITACHGVLDFEKRIPQPFVLDITLEGDLAPAGRDDDLTASVSYAEVAARAVQIVEGEPVDLIETLAERVAQACFAWLLVEAVTVTVHKPNAPAGVSFMPTSAPMAGPSVTVRRERRREVVIALGTNLGRRVATLVSAVDCLRRVPGLDVVHVSPLVETDPVGGVEQPDYLNAVVVGTTRLAPEHLMRVLHDIEAQHGRRRGVRWGARTLDLDLVQLGTPGEDDEVRLGGERDGIAAGDAGAIRSPLAVPHPRAHERSFVLVPWAQATPWALLRRPDAAEPVSVLDQARDLGLDGVRPGPAWSDVEPFEAPFFDEGGQR